MKYKYEIITGKLVGPGGPLQANARKIQHLIFLQANNMPVAEEDLDLSGDVDYEFGGCFMPCEGEYEDHPLFLSPINIIDKYKDHDHEADCYITKFTYMTQMDKERIHSGYIGKWVDNIDKEAKLYYIIMNDGPHKMFITKFNNMQFTGTSDVQYVVNIDNKMMDCIPEEGDILFDNKEEASEYFKNEYAKDLQAKLQAFAEAERKRLEEEEFKKHVESLGDGTYVGQMTGCMFYYRGNEYICPIAKRCSFPVNTIIEIKNGKVSFKEWGTPYDKWLNKDK